MAVAVFFAVLLKNKYLVLFLVIWAMLVAYSRIYLGVHFPLDVLTGMLVGLIFGWAMVGFAVAIAVNGFLLLETVNYIEHYGLLRRKNKQGRYEPVLPIHSWNSNHELGRIFLYELTRHSDHHFRATRKYQILRAFRESPQLPAGYPACMLLALVPPLWFAVMNSRVEGFNERVASARPVGA